MSVSSALAQPCPHLATPQEQGRDPVYQACGARPGDPCRWARRYDGFTNPPFHAERLESDWAPSSPASGEELEKLRDAVLQSGLV